MTEVARDTAAAQALALAAVVEAACLVEQLARDGDAPVSEMEPLLEGLFRFEWLSPADVFGDASRLRRGLVQLEALLRDPAAPAQRGLLRLTLALLHLGRQLARDRTMLMRIREGLQHIVPQRTHAGERFDELAASVAAIYQQSISTYPYRIRVHGNARHLQDPRVAARIRALLLTALRAVVLWRFCGGNRAALVIGRRRLLGACVSLRHEGS